ncbi:MAG: HD domain-containing protein [Promethearchaeota archaeon]
MKKIDKVIKLCKKVYPAHNYKCHLKPVVTIALQLCKEFGAQRNIVEPAAYLHDIGRVRIPFAQKQHNLTGYFYSKFKLWIYRFPKEERKRICYAILAHRSNSKYKPKSLEDEIIINADAISHFEQYLYLLNIRYCSQGKNLNQTKKWLLNKLKRDYENKLTLPGIKERVKPFYERAKKVLIIK